MLESPAGATGLASRTRRMGGQGRQATPGPLNLSGVAGGGDGQVPGEPDMTGVYPLGQGQSDH